jgi:serine phosphatase RsbU (regulator of sigma subunit)
MPNLARTGYISPKASVAGVRVGRNHLRAVTDSHILAEIERSALPSKLPEAPAAIVEVSYSARHDHMIVGGDWYDAFEVSDGRMLITVGDVCGSGPKAAVTMATLRNVVRALTLVTLDLADLMSYADTFLRTYDPECFATAFFGLYDPITRELQSVLCGHPTPLLRVGPDALEELGGDVYPPLGLLDLGPRVSIARQKMPFGALLFCYTDGIIEGQRDAITGLRLLRAALRNDDLATSPKALVRWLFRELRPPDDAMAMAIRFSDRQPSLPLKDGIEGQHPTARSRSIVR